MKYLFSFLVIALSLSVAYGVFAINKDDIVYPIAELGDCPNEQACFAYCGDPANLNQCLDFAEQHNLMSQAEIEKARKFQSIGAIGPGGCTTEQECEAYCHDVTNIAECLAFAEQHGFMDPKELEEAKKVASALRAGAQLPGGCQSKDACEAYCEDPNNMRECIAFAEAAGFMSPEELREAKQVLKALDAGIALPGNCRGEDECEAYCEDPNHMEECVEFGIAAGFIPPEEAEQVRRMIPLMKEGKMPEGCRAGKEECEAYCADEANTEECTTFFVEAGFMTAEEAEMFQKTGGKGPGGCSGQAECEAFCNNPANQQACFDFGKEHGLISEDDLQNIQEGVGKFEEGFAAAPPEVEQCLKERLGHDVLAKMQAGTFLPSPELGDVMGQCFEEFLPRPGEGEFPGGLPPGGGFEPETKTPEQVKCIEGIIGFIDNPRNAREEERIARECFGAGDFVPPPGFEGEHPQGGFQEQFQQQFEQEFEQQFQQEVEQQFQQQFEREFQEQFQQEVERQQQEQLQEQLQEQQQHQLEQFQQVIPPAPQFQSGGGGPSPEEIQRIEQEEAATLEQQQQQEQIQQQQLEQELQQQFQELEQLQQLQDQQPPPGGSGTDAFLYLLRPLVPR